MTSHRSSPHPVVIVGAGISGLALAGRLEHLGIRPMILDAAPCIAETWRRRHKQLRLNTHRHFSRLPGRSLPRHTGPFASRNAVIRYLEAYHRGLRSPIAFGVRISRIDKLEDHWCLRTSAGDILARHVVVATGRERVPMVPRWSGAEGFTGTLHHAADFGDVETYRDRSVLVVGAGNSGVDVLNHLVRVRTRELWLAVRSGTTVVPTWLMGFPVQRLSGVMSLLPTRLVDRLLATTEYVTFGDLGRFGLPRNSVGAATRLAQEGVAPAIDDGFVAALRSGQVTVVPAVASFEHEHVVLSDRQKLQPDIVIAATGYSPGLESLVGHLDALDDRGIPRFQGAEADADLPGLWFLGMRPRLFGTFHAARCDSLALATRIARTASQQQERTVTRSRRLDWTSAVNTTHTETVN
jgi:cation diffusion facilitator CzcD-associated flavoprotein CzcO